MIPVDRVESSNLRDAVTDLQLFEKIMFTLPEELPDSHRVRQAKLESVLKTGKPRQLIRTLRDLCWKEWSHKLTSTDSHLRGKIHKRLVNELSADPSMTIQQIRQNISNIIESAMLKHEKVLVDQVATT